MRNYWKGKRRSEETKRKMSEALKGRKFSEEHKRNISKALVGRKFSEKHKEKISEAVRGNKSPSWRGGISFELYSVDWTKTLKRSIRERDHYICQLCLKEGYPVHHIDYDKKNCNPENLITLCSFCHNKTNFHREIWMVILEEKILERRR